MPAHLVCDALKMAIANRRPAAGLIVHSDQGSQGGFKRSSQHAIFLRNQALRMVRPVRHVR
jgi:transposase InsO family protein